jgi:hypothetical protein
LPDPSDLEGRVFCPKVGMLTVNGVDAGILVRQARRRSTRLASSAYGFVQLRPLRARFARSLSAGSWPTAWAVHKAAEYSAATMEPTYRSVHIVAEAIDNKLRNESAKLRNRQL